LCLHHTLVSCSINQELQNKDSRLGRTFLLRRRLIIRHKSSREVGVDMGVGVDVGVSGDGDGDLNDDVGGQRR
jgi:hypothetical protein